MSKTRAIMASLYMMFIYWASTQFPDVHTLFFPTLGAFCLLFLKRTQERKAQFNIMIGAIIGACIGTTLYTIDHGPITFFINALLMIGLITKMKWNAPPIMAVSFIPFFSHPKVIWSLPVSVAVSLVGLLAMLWLTEAVEQGISVRVPKREDIEIETGL
ncbi:HPP family protein [Paenibacillus sp. PR3]|uniref:HPP family protein n=1 Tax=Paenibacillus terricola TaxID=2763503 RepID=A0ABR8MNT6_9BACL|nr:HPP family protein [Paenibacillus terricola]MBD3917672.1 HPP family protein [Paenibacillus terricola]